MKTLFLIDGTALIYRSFFAFIRNPLRTRQGFNTSAIFGTINSFIKLLETYDVDHVAISFDRKEKTFRHEITDTYKANRPPAPDELVQQIAPVKRFFEMIGVPEFSCAGYEADDVLATLTSRCKDDYRVILVTGDKDFAQLVDQQVLIFDPGKNVEINREAVIEKYGITPEQFIDYLALVGDSADNIPGVKGIGPKSATRLLQEYGTLDGIYQHVEDIKAKGTRTKLQEHKDDAYLSRQLATIVTQVPLPDLNADDLCFSRDDLARALPLLEEFELTSLAAKLHPAEAFREEFDFGLDAEEPVATQAPFSWHLISTTSQLQEALASLADAEVVAIDTETTSTDSLQAELVGVSFCAHPSQAFYVSIAHQMAENVPAKDALELIATALKDTLLVGHNIKYDYTVLRRAGWTLQNPLFDTMIAHYLLHPADRHSLDHCASREFDHTMIPIAELIGRGQKQVTFDLVPPEQAAPYAAEDAWMTLKLYQRLEPEINKAGLYPLFAKMEMPLLYVLEAMEAKGVHIDVAMLNEMSKQNQKTLAELTRRVYEIAGYQFNLNSTQQLGKLLFEDLGLPPVKKTKTGYSTNVTVLEKLAPDHEIAHLMLEYRQITKLESTYITALPNLINPNSGRVHTSFNQTVASTGRLSSTNPNLQNIPIRTELGREIRKAFCARDAEHVIVAADYSQIELRLLAIMSQDANMIAAFRSGADIHRQTASLVFDIMPQLVTSDQRRYAKIINFGLMYGMGAHRVSQELGISRKEAAQFIDNYFAKFPTIRTWLDAGIEQARKDGFVQTLFGRKLPLPGINSSNGMIRSEAERVATNMPIQGSAADIIKLAMIDLHEVLQGRTDILMMIQVHDELVFEVHRDALEEARQLIRKTMEGALPEEYRSIVPLVVDVGVGQNWFEAH
jgi:DNA polymerase-1